MTEQTAVADPTITDPAALASEAADARALNQQASETNQNPPPEAGSSHQEPAADATPAERPLSKREEIAARFKKHRDEAAEFEPPTELVFDPNTGNEIPPFIQAGAEEPVVEETTAAAAEEKDEKPTTFKIKVNRNEHTLTYDQLVELAGLDAEEAKGLPTTSLVRAAQINAAAQENLTNSKTRAPAPAPDGSTQPDAEPTGTKDRSDPDATPSPTRDDRTREALEKIQFGEPEEAAKALDDLVDSRVHDTLTAHEQKKVMEAVDKQISTEVTAFEQANTDLFGNDDLARAVYDGPVLRGIKAELVKNGASQEAVDKAIPNVFVALEVYTAARAAGKKVATPTEILTAAASDFRTKTGLKARTTTTTEPPAVAPLADRRAAKRQLPPQPNRSAAPPAVAAKQDGQDPAKRSSVVMDMKKRRGQSTY